MTAHHDAKPQKLDDGGWGARIWSDDDVNVGDSVTSTTKAGVSRTEYVAEVVKVDRKLKIVRTSEDPPDGLGWPEPGDPPIIGSGDPPFDEPPPWPDEPPQERVPFPPREEQPQYPSEPAPAPSPPGFAGDVERLVRDFRDACNRFLRET